MRRLISLCLVIIMSLTGCAQNAASSTSASSVETEASVSESGEQGTLDENLVHVEDIDDQQPEGYDDLSDPELLRYIEDNVYRSLVSKLDSDEYFIENVSAIYISKEYIEELTYNSQANVFFGYTLADLDKAFQGTKYVFTLDEDGTTTVKAFENYDDTYDRVLKNVLVGSGVILFCVTVSAVTGGLGAPAVSMIFAASAKTGTAVALSSGAFGALTSGIITGYQTGDFEQALKSAALNGSEAFKWGAFTGAITGGAGEAVALHGATLNGLSMNEAAIIQRESGFPLDVIKEFRSMEQYEICKEAGLTAKIVDGKIALIRDIDLNFTDEVGRTNLERMRQGYAALDSSGAQYQLHHIGQKQESTLAILTRAEHMQGGNNEIWHIIGEASNVDHGSIWTQQRAEFWKNMAVMLGG